MSSMRQSVVPTLAAFVPNMSLVSSACSWQAPSPQSVLLRTLEVGKVFFSVFILQLSGKTYIAAAFSQQFTLNHRYWLRLIFEPILKNSDLGNYPSTMPQSSPFAQREPMARGGRNHLCRFEHVNHSRYLTLDCPQNVQCKIRYGWHLNRHWTRKQ